jgi:hypothetical protein
MGVFGLHVILAMLVSTILGGLLCVLVGALVNHGTENAMLDAPYSPLLWGSAGVCGFFFSRKLPSKYSSWVWIVGVAWLLLGIVSDLQWYDPRWCRGCSKLMWVWYNYFSYRDSMQEGLGLLLVTGPMLNSVGYSIGAYISSVAQQKKLAASR